MQLLYASGGFVLSGFLVLIQGKRSKGTCIFTNTQSVCALCTAVDLLFAKGSLQRDETFAGR